MEVAGDYISGVMPSQIEIIAVIFIKMRGERMWISVLVGTKCAFVARIACVRIVSYQLGPPSDCFQY